jgi:hypothetical protein
MKEKIEQTLNILVGLPLWASGRAVDLQWFDFGEHRTTVTRKGKTMEVGEYALHVQCAWRICTQDKVFVASRDLYYPPGETSDVPDDFDWDISQGSRRDQRIQLFFQEHTAHPLIVTSVEADRAGSARFFLTEEYALEIFPDDSFSDDHSEHWRLFQPSTDAPHFVVTGYGIEE